MLHVYMEKNHILSYQIDVNHKIYFHFTKIYQ